MNFRSPPFSVRFGVESISVGLNHTYWRLQEHRKGPTEVKRAMTPVRAAGVTAGPEGRVVGERSGAPGRYRVLTTFPREVGK